MSQVLSSSLTLMRRLPPSNLRQNLSNLQSLIPNDQIFQQISSRLDKSITVSECPTTHRPYIQCQFNKQLQSYRSPWSNQYDPPLQHFVTPSQTLRILQIRANQIFAEYVKLYYDKAQFSVYFQDYKQNEFVCAFLVHKVSELGKWESCCVINAKLTPESRSVSYNASCSVRLQLAVSNPFAGETSVSASVSRNASDTKPLDPDMYGEKHIYNMISLIQNTESQIRLALDQIYIGKTMEIMDRTRQIQVPQHRPFKLPQQLIF